LIVFFFVLQLTGSPGSRQ